MQSGAVLVDGVRCHYLQAGPEAGPALVLVHGLIGSAQTWELNLESLGLARTVYALDLANMGESESVPGLDASMAAEAGRIVGWMDALGIADADFAGHSHGGSVVMMLAALYPERVRTMVLFAPANPFCGASRRLIAFYNSRAGTWCARRIPLMPRSVHHWAHKRVYGDKTKATPAALTAYTSALNGASIEHVLRIVRRWNRDMAALRGRLAEVAKKPTLLVWGEVDPAVSVASAETLRAALGARLVVLPGVGHIPFAEMPEECNRLMGEWLAGAEAKVLGREI